MSRSTIAACACRSRSRRTGVRRARSATRGATAPRGTTARRRARAGSSRTSMTVAPFARAGTPRRPRRRARRGSRRAVLAPPVPGGTFGNGGTPRVTARRFASAVRSDVDAAVVLGDHPEHRRGEPLRRGVRADLPHVDREDRAAGLLDPLDDLGLHGKRADETIEVRDHDDLGLACLDHLDGAAEPGDASQAAPRRRRRAPRWCRPASSRRARTARIRSICSFGDTNRSPSRSPTRETRTTPTARRTEAALPVEEGRPAPDFTLNVGFGRDGHVVLLKG